MTSEDAQHLSEVLRAVIEGNGKQGAELFIKYARVPPKLTEKQIGNLKNFKKFLLY